jgi:ribokinase
MTIFNMGSINIDHIYLLPHLVKSGETLASEGYQTALGGKGANQSIAIARAGAKVVHGGMINITDEAWLGDMRDAGVDISHIIRGKEVPTGHAVVAVDAQKGENQIILCPSSNAAIPDSLIEEMLADAAPGDWALSQNEVNLTSAFLHAAREKGLKICYSAAPFSAGTAAALLPITDLLVVNEIEAAALKGHLGGEVNVPDLIITRGADGADHIRRGKLHHVDAVKAAPVDTTGAGDTYLGYVLAGLDQGMEMWDAMALAARAAAHQVSRPGASEAIPRRAELD